MTLTMPPTEFRNCLAGLNTNQRDIAGCIPVDDRLVRRWAAGGVPIPPEVAGWLRALCVEGEISSIPMEVAGWLDAIIAQCPPPKPHAGWFQRPKTAA